MRWPFVSRKRHEAELLDCKESARQERRRLVVDHGKEMIELQESIAGIVDRCSRIRYTQPSRGDVYAVSISFDAREFSHFRSDQRLFAQMIARRVEHDIATGRFVKSADEYERECEERLSRGAAIE